MELTINNLIKILIGLVVIVAVVYGVYRAVTGSITDVFGNYLFIKIARGFVNGF